MQGQRDLLGVRKLGGHQRHCPTGEQSDLAVPEIVKPWHAEEHNLLRAKCRSTVDDHLTARTQIHFQIEVEKALCGSVHTQGDLGML